MCCMKNGLKLFYAMHVRRRRRHRLKTEVIFSFLVLCNFDIKNSFVCKSSMCSSESIKPFDISLALVMSNYYFRIAA